MNTLIWVAVPYLCLAMFLAGHVWRWRRDQFGWSTHTSQLLEGRILRWGSPLFHFGAFGVIGGHVLGLLIPARATAAVGLSEHAYHLIAVTAGTITGLMLTIGLLLLIIRRIVNRRVRRATSPMDRVLYGALGIMVALGMIATVAVNVFGPGYDYRDTIAVWFRGVLLFSPDAGLMAGAPLVYQLHAIGGFLLLALWPFTRLVHVLSAPVAYLWRPYVIYRGRRGPVPGSSPRPAHVRDAALSTSARTPESTP